MTFCDRTDRFCWGRLSDGCCEKYAERFGGEKALLFLKCLLEHLLMIDYIVRTIVV